VRSAGILSENSPSLFEMVEIFIPDTIRLAYGKVFPDFLSTILPLYSVKVSESVFFDPGKFEKVFAVTGITDTIRTNNRLTLFCQMDCGFEFSYSTDLIVRTFKNK